MPTIYGPYGTCGNDTDSNGDVWYPHWHIELRDGSINPKTVFYGSLNKRDLRKELLLASAKNPHHEVWLIASARVRMVAKDGEILSESRYDDFYLGPYGDEARIFNDVECCDHHIYGLKFR